MNILITGCAGFIGYHLTKKFIKNGYNVYGCDNLSSVSIKTQRQRIKELKNIKKFNFKKLDITNYDLLKNYYKNTKINLVVHLAAQPGVRLSIEKPQGTINNNVKAFINMLELCNKKKIKNFFYASSSSVYGNSKNFKEEKNLKNTTSLYAATKLSNEIFASYYSYLFKINSLGLRFFTVYGEYGREDMAYFKFLKEIKKTKKITIYGNKRSFRSFTYIDDVIEAISKLTKKFANKKK